MLISLCGCQNTQKEKTVCDIYPEIINECVMKETESEDIKAMLEKGTGIVFFSWSDCPWCHHYINYVNEAARLNEMTVLYYDIYEDRENNTEFYKFVTDYIKDSVEIYSYSTDGKIKEAYDSDGKVRIYVPMVIYVVQGQIIGMDYEGSMEEDYDLNHEAFFKEMVNDSYNRTELLIKNLEKWSLNIATVKKEHDEQGCDDDCVIEE